VVDRAIGKLVLGPTVLGEWGKEGVKLGLSKADQQWFLLQVAQDQTWQHHRGLRWYTREWAGMGTRRCRGWDQWKWA